MRKFERIKGSTADFPQRATEKSAGYDIKAYGTTVINPMECKNIPTGLKAAAVNRNNLFIICLLIYCKSMNNIILNKDEYLQLVARSSLYKKYNCIIPGGFGVIDADYYNNTDNEGHFMIPLLNLSNTPVFIPFGERIAQGIFVKYLKTNDDLPVLQVRKGGFGSTDV